MNEMQRLQAQAAEAAPQHEYGFETIAVHAGARPDPVTGARSTPIYQTTSYAFDDADHAAELFNLQTFGYIYSRITNPTVAVLEERVAALENGRGAVAAATGHAAQFLVGATLLESGDEFISSNNLYGGSVTQFGVSFKKLGWHCHFVDMTEPENVERAMTDKVKFIFCEGLANPGGIVLDLEAVAEVAKRHGVPLIVDNTMASPYLCRPFEHGADLVIHSTTKFIGGHGNTMGGMVVESGRFDWWQNDKFPSMTKPDPAYHGLTFAETFGDFGFTMKMRAVALRDYGPSMAAQAAWNLLQGVETLPLRMERHCSNALAVARYLEGHSKVSWVLLRRAGVEPLLRAGPEVPAAWRRCGLHLRPQGRLRGGPHGGRQGEHVLASRQYRRHAEPHHPTRPPPPIGSSPTNRRAGPGPGRTWCGSRSASRASTTSSPTSTRPSIRPDGRPRRRFARGALAGGEQAAAERAVELHGDADAGKRAQMFVEARFAKWFTLRRDESAGHPGPPGSPDAGPHFQVAAFQSRALGRLR